MVFIWRIKFCI